MKVFHHNDNDGRLSAFLIRRFVLKHFPLTEIEFIETNFDQPFAIDSVCKNETVWIVDFSIEPEMMVKLMCITNDIHWIDHHGTAIDKYTRYAVANPETFKGQLAFEYATSLGPVSCIGGLRSVDHAACVLTYMYCYKKYEGRKYRSIPWFIRLVGDRDIWAWQYGERSKFFHRGLQAEDTSPESPIWYDVWRSTRWLEKRGAIIEAGLERQAEETIKECSFEVGFHGHRCLAINASAPFLRSSEYFEKFAPDYDIWMPFRFANGCWTVSLYSKTIDTSVIAQQYELNGKRGGGHPLTNRGSASGFQAKSLPWVDGFGYL